MNRQSEEGGILVETLVAFVVVSLAAVAFLKGLSSAIRDGAAVEVTLDGLEGARHALALREIGDHGAPTDRVPSADSEGQTIEETTIADEPGRFELRRLTVTIALEAGSPHIVLESYVVRPSRP